MSLHIYLYLSEALRASREQVKEDGRDSLKILVLHFPAPVVSTDVSSWRT